MTGAALLKSRAVPLMIGVLPMLSFVAVTASAALRVSAVAVATVGVAVPVVGLVWLASSS